MDASSKARIRVPRGARNGVRPRPVGVLVGTWRLSPPFTGAGPYAVYASIDLYKRVSRHIVSEDVQRQPLPGLKSNSVRHENIDYISPFLGLSDPEVKLKVFEELNEEPPPVPSRGASMPQRRHTIQPPSQRLIKSIEKLAFLPDSKAPDAQRFFQAWTRCADFLPANANLHQTPPSLWPQLLSPDAQNDEELLWFLDRFGKFWQLLNP